ncbi:HAD-IIA family hydrolase [Altericroceibacterium endophyticum]|uniref:HAD hydrolase-like protein n=1 Tax=Altericroceibacterium endophyticum TaxID=1808508 RepID=A0A6I4T536_9SPHN|nr:HAD family hydrolase [Altericroceibacterium endophyticum]MXO64815.1 HAD hydrolase-like protein [Altericroceibacterium endophyticum]
MTDIPDHLAERIAAAKAFIFDMDGTIALGNAASGGHEALPGAIELLGAIRKLGKPFRVFTNGTGKPPAAYAARLREAGFDVADEEFMTPSTAAAIWFEQQGISKVRVLGRDGVSAPLLDKGIECVEPAAEASGVEAVYTGWYREFTFPDLEAACQSVWDGAILTSASHVPFFATAGGRAIGASYALNVMIQSLTNAELTVLGKPSVTAFQSAIAGMGLTPEDSAEVVIVGDDPVLEIGMAHATGALGVGMTTGLMKRDTIGELPADQQPEVLIDRLDSLRAVIA